MNDNNKYVGILEVSFNKGHLDVINTRIYMKFINFYQNYYIHEIILSFHYLWHFFSKL